MAGRKNGAVAVLRNRDFLALWLGQLVSRVGDNIATVAGLVLINEYANKPGIAVVVIAVVQTIPSLFALASGVLLDRFSRKWVMILTDLLRAGAVLLPLLVRRADQLFVLYIAAFVINALGAVFAPARNASIPNMVKEEQLLTANALIQATDLASLILGASLATLMIGLFGTPAAFIMDSGSFILSAVLIFFARIPSAGQVAAAPATIGAFRSFWASFTEGLHYIRGHRFLLQLMAITLMATLGLSATVLLAVAFFNKLFNVGSEYLGLLQTMEGLGMAIGAVLVGIYASWARSRRIVSGNMIFLGIATLTFAIAPRYWMVLMGALVVGLCVVSARSTLAAMTQALVPDIRRGRVESAMVTVTGLGTMGALVLAGVGADIIGPNGPRIIFFVTGLAVLAAGIVSIFTLRGTERYLTDQMNDSFLPQA
ncbi:MAG TPA: MFS transporter [Anaerolineae bacterium]|nr:MFS transporter [Anaerolineae bacterium]